MNPGMTEPEPTPYSKLEDQPNTMYCGSECEEKSFFSRVRKQDNSVPDPHPSQPQQEQENHSESSLACTQEPNRSLYTSQEQNSTLYSPEEPSRSLYSRLSLARLDGGGLAIKGMVVAAYCNVFLIIMAIFLLLGGVLLTAIAFRPKEMREEFGEWTDRLARSSKSRVAGPVLIIISLVVLSAGLTLIILNRLAQREEGAKSEGNSPDLEGSRQPTSDKGPYQVTRVLSGNSPDREGLLTQTIACFPDKIKLLRTSSSLLRKVSSSHKRTQSLQTRVEVEEWRKDGKEERKEVGQAREWSWSLGRKQRRNSGPRDYQQM